jgi:putative PIN family toxin of toxin-antitoxin system
MKVVLDTNVLVSGLLSHQGAAAQVVGMAAAGAITLCFDARILEEYRQVLGRPRFGFPSQAVSALLDQLRAGGEFVTTKPLPAALPDPRDEPFLEAAIAGHAEFLVTFNLKHYPATARCGVPVGPPVEFLRHYRRRSA